MDLFNEAFMEVLATKIAAKMESKLSSPKRKGDDKYLTMKELMGYLKVSQNWIYRAVGNRSIPHYKIGRELRFERKEIDAWLKDLSSPAVNPLTYGKKAIGG